MKRLYTDWIRQHFRDFRQMVFLAGPRQVGKTTTCLLLAKNSKNFFYFNWDDDKTRQLLLTGYDLIVEKAELIKARKQKPVLVFDEIHKFSQWKQFLKGFFDLYGERCHLLITGSAKLNIYKKTGDSLMGRYFLYRMHPLSVGELLRPHVDEILIYEPKRIPNKTFEQLLKFGGFPEPFLKVNSRFSSNWHRLRKEQLIKEDIRDLRQIQELALLEKLALILRECVSQQISLTTLANHLNVSVPTISRWLETLESFYYCFSIRPWSKNIKRSLRKEPKYYLWDWTLAKNSGALQENFVASHLLKATHFWTDYGLGEFELYYLRDKEKREVDFIVTREGEPWFLVEVKRGNNHGISKSLFHFHSLTGAPHAFQINFGLKYEEVDCFSYKTPIIVPATTFLSQLI